MTKNELINNAKAKGFQIEFSTDKFDNELIGINKGKWSYHWFRVWNYRGEDEVSFYHTYSQLTGKSKKGTMHSIRVERSLGFYN